MCQANGGRGGSANPAGRRRPRKAAGCLFTFRHVGFKLVKGWSSGRENPRGLKTKSDGLMVDVSINQHTYLQTALKVIKQDDVTINQHTDTGFFESKLKL